MVFSSIPRYPDPPNFHQQELQNENNQHPTPPPFLPPSTGGGGSVSIRSSSISKPSSRADRARLPKILQHDAAALKCPRCESTNTKFCYFNNYSLTQPRHFCKTCRRYWTRGGALRNVPVGGGCRRNNKRSKASSRRSKSPSAAVSISTTNILGHQRPPSQIHLPFLPHLHNNLADSGLTFESIQPPAVTGGGRVTCCGDVEFQIGEQWRVQQFPFLCNLEPSTELYTTEGDGVAPSGYGGAGELRPKPAFEVRSDQVGGGVKMEENHQVGLNLLSRNFLGLQGNDQYWSGSNAWSSTDHLSGFSSSTSYFL